MSKKQEDNRDVFDKVADYLAPAVGAVIGARLGGRGVGKAWRETGDHLARKEALFDKLSAKQKYLARKGERTGHSEYDSASAAEVASDRRFVGRVRRGAAGSVGGGAAGYVAGQEFKQRRK